MSRVSTRLKPLTASRSMRFSPEQLETLDGLASEAHDLTGMNCRDVDVVRALIKYAVRNKLSASALFLQAE